MTDKERITALEARIAALEAQLANLEMSHVKYWPIVPVQPFIPMQLPNWTVTCGDALPQNKAVQG